MPPTQPLKGQEKGSLCASYCNLFCNSIRALCLIFQPCLGPINEILDDVNVTAQWPWMVQFINNGHYCWFNSSSVALMWTMKKLHLKIPRKKDQDFGIFWNWIRYWFNLDRKNGCTLEQEPQEAMKHLAAEFLDGDQSFLTDQKPGETIFEFVPGFIDFLKPSTEEKRNKGPCLNCGVSSTTVIHHVQVCKEFVLIEL